MGEVIYSLNGKYFKDFGVRISSSDGLGDVLKTKKTETYDWPEYHGLAIDNSKKPIYEPREIELKGWIVGENWKDMHQKFHNLFGEFSNAGKQRLLIEIFNEGNYVFDVKCEGGIKLTKTFSDDIMVGTFTFKLIEHSPIKKVLSIANPNLQLAFNSPKWVEVNIDGAIESHKGVVNINKTLPNRSLTHYNFGGRNLLLNTDFRKDINHWGSLDLGEIIEWRSDDNGCIFLNNNANKGGFNQVFFSIPNIYAVSFDVKPLLQNGQAPYKLRISVGGVFEDIDIHSQNEWRRYSLIIDNSSTTVNSIFAIQALGDQRLVFKNIKLEKGNKATDWTPAPEEEHFITIAGNIDEITNLTTNAEVLWEKL